MFTTRLFYGALTQREFGSDDPAVELDVLNDPNFLVPLGDLEGADNSTEEALQEAQDFEEIREFHGLPVVPLY